MNSDHGAAEHYSHRSFAMREAFEERLAIMLVDGRLEFELARRIAFALTYDPPLAEVLRSATLREMIVLTDQRRPGASLGRVAFPDDNEIGSFAGVRGRGRGEHAERR